MDPVAAAGDLPILALSRRSVEQAGIPDQRHSDDAAIAQTHAERIVRGLHIQHALICRRLPKNSFHASSDSALCSITIDCIVPFATDACWRIFPKQHSFLRNFEREGHGFSRAVIG
jgi:hypothetical protein